MSRTGPARVRDSVGTLVSCAIGFIRETGLTVGVRCGLLSLLIWRVDGSVYACAGKALQIPFTNPGPWFALVLASLQWSFRVPLDTSALSIFPRVLV